MMRMSGMGQGEGEGGALVFDRVDGDTAAVGARDVTDHGEAEAGAGDAGMDGIAGADEFLE